MLDKDRGYTRARIIQNPSELRELDVLVGGTYDIVSTEIVDGVLAYTLDTEGIVDDISYTRWNVACLQLVGDDEDELQDDEYNQEFNPISIIDISDTDLYSLRETTPCLCGNIIEFVATINGVPFMMCPACVAKLGKEAIDALM